MAAPSASSRSPPRGVAGHWRPAIKSVPSLQLPHKVLVDFLTNGHGYDSESTGTLVKEGNKLFAMRELQRAAEVYGAAYEIARLHYVYPPLMHDLVLRRVVCLSMLGDLKRAVFEVELALQILPHAPTTYLMCGILYSKMHRTDDANLAFHRAVEQCAILRDLTECMVALFAQARGHCDHAIEICTQVLLRTPGYPAALLARSTAYRYHASGYFEKQAAADHQSLLEVDAQAAPLATERFTLDSHGQVEELLLHFHPWFASQGPRPYEDYPVYPQRQPFVHVCLVLLAIAKLRTLVRSSRLVRSVQQKHEELLKQRAAAERRMSELVEAQRNFAHLEQHTEVWGPADPDHQLVRKYRRYWMERPADFPRRSEGGAHGQPLTVENTAAVRGQQQGQPAEPFPPLPFAPIADDPPSASWLELGVAPTASSSAPPPCLYAPPTPPPECVDNDAGTAPARPSPAANSRPGSATSDRGAAVPSFVQAAAQSGGMPPMPASVPNFLLPRPSSGGPRNPASDEFAQSAPAGAFSQTEMGRLEAPRQPDIHGSAPLPRQPGGSTPPVSLSGSDSGVPSAARTVPAARGGGLPPTPNAASPYRTATPMLAASPGGTIAAYVDKPPPRKIGAGWSEEQWFLKGLELAEGYAKGSTTSALAMPPSCLAPKVPDHQPCREQSPPPWCRIRRVVDDQDAGSLIEAVERDGFDACPDWYGSLDRIYAITDMALVTEKPEPFVGDAQKAGAPGFSYLIPKAGTQQKDITFSPGEEEARTRAHEALMQRYQNRLLVTSLPNRSHAVRTPGGG